MGIYLGAGEGVLNFDAYASVALDSWDQQRGAIDTARWAVAARETMDPWSEIGQEPNMPTSHIAREFGVPRPVVQLPDRVRGQHAGDRRGGTTSCDAAMPTSCSPAVRTR